MQAPNIEPVIIPARSELLLIKRPLQPADLLFVPNKFIHKKLVSHSDVSDQNIFISGTTCENVISIPCYRAHPAPMASICIGFLVFNAIPKLDLTRVGADAQHIGGGA